MSGDSGDNFSFDKQIFFSDKFSVDTFVSEQRKAVSLDRLKDELNVYLKYLRNCMVELINKDYADFVNLSSSMASLDKYLRNISNPLEQLKEEVLGVRSSLKENLDYVETLIEDKSETEKQERRLLAAQNLSLIREFIGETVNTLSEDWQQIVICLYHCKSVASVCKNLPYVQQYLEDINNYSNSVWSEVDKIFLNAVANEDVNTLNIILRVGVVVDASSRLEETFRTSVVRPALKEIITEKNLRSVDASGIFNQILMFLTMKCKTLIEMAASMKEYDILGRSIWPELISISETQVASLFSITSASTFHRRYLALQAFLEQLVKYRSSSTSPNFEQLLSKWNLPVYFQLRYQEFALAVERQIQSDCQGAIGSEFFLTTSSGCWQQIEICWSENVFLYELTPKFWTLTLQIISRYQKWATSQIARIAQQQPDLNFTFNEWSESAGILKEQCFMLMLFADLENLSKKLQRLVDQQLITLFDENSAKLIRCSSDECIKAIKETQNLIHNGLVAVLTDGCSKPLQQVIDIPRLYRRTNREVPSVASAYVDGVLDPLNAIRTYSEETLLIPWSCSLSEQVLTRVTQRYFTLTSDLLDSVKKMEDSLKRLKKDRVQKAADGKVSDDDKIRLQLLLDVKRYGDNIQNSGQHLSDLSVYQKLLEVVEQATDQVVRP